MTGNQRTKSLLFVLVLAAVVIGFGQLPLRMQGRVIEVVTLGEWPLEWAVHRHVERKQPELHSIIEFMSEQPDIAGLTVAAVGLQARLASEKRFIGHDLDRPDILQALISIQAQFVEGHEDRISVFMGTEYRGKTVFDMSYVYPLKPIEMPLCSAVEESSREKIGYCGIALNADWYVVYQWEPTDTDELLKALDAMKQ